MLPSKNIRFGSLLALMCSFILLSTTVIYGTNLHSAIVRELGVKGCQSCQTNADRAREAVGRAVVMPDGPLVAWVGMTDALRPWGVASIWDAAAQRVTTGGSKPRIEVVVGKDTARVAGREVRLQSPARFVNGRVEVPVSLLVEMQTAFLDAGLPQRMQIPAPVSSRETDPRCLQCHGGATAAHQSAIRPEPPSEGSRPHSR